MALARCFAESHRPRPPPPNTILYSVVTSATSECPTILTVTAPREGMKVKRRDRSTSVGLLVANALRLDGRRRRKCVAYESASCRSRWSGAVCGGAPRQAAPPLNMVEKALYERRFCVVTVGARKSRIILLSRGYAYERHLPATF